MFQLSLAMILVSQIFQSEGLNYLKKDSYIACYIICQLPLMIVKPKNYHFLDKTVLYNIQIDHISTKFTALIAIIVSRFSNLYQSNVSFLKTYGDFKNGSEQSLGNFNAWATFPQFNVSWCQHRRYTVTDWSMRQLFQLRPLTVSIFKFLYQVN